MTSHPMAWHHTHTLCHNTLWHDITPTPYGMTSHPMAWHHTLWHDITPHHMASTSPHGFRCQPRPRPLLPSAPSSAQGLSEAAQKAWQRNSAAQYSTQHTWWSAQGGPCPGITHRVVSPGGPLPRNTQGGRPRGAPAPESHTGASHATSVTNKQLNKERHSPWT